MSTARELVAEARQYLFAGTREEYNRLDGALTTSAEQVTFDFDLGGIAPGAVIAVDLELMLVWSASAKTATVQRGWGETTPATHDDGAITTLNPKFSDFAIFNAINAELNALSSPKNGLFQAKTVNFTFNPAVMAYDLTGATAVSEIYEIRYEATGPAKDWPEIQAFELDRDADTTDFPSGFAVILKESAQAGRTVKVTYKAPFSQLTALANNVQTTAGLSQFADDIPPLGAGLRLQVMREGPRSHFEHQGDTRRAEEVPPGSQLRGAAGLESQYQKRVREEAARLQKDYPPRTL